MGKFTAYKIPLKSLGVGSHDFEYRLGKQFFADMESNDIHDADLLVKVTVDYNGEYYQLAMHISGEVVLICDRCLDDLQFPVDTTYGITVKYGEDYNDESDDVLEIPLSDSTLNVAYMIYDTVELAVPIKHVHPLGKCNRQMSALLKKHRAVREGDEDAELENELIDEIETTDLPSEPDPRWDALRKLSDGDDNNTIE